jgi:aspartyl-tRNA(Asn)/glutamyl-tRNA(Gln) amidotransferase subunit A
MPPDDLTRLSIAEAGDLLRRRALSPVELTRAHLDRIQRLDRDLLAYLTVLQEGALAAATAMEQEIARGQYRGPLHGIPIALKDLVMTRGVRTTCGSRILRDWIPDVDATVARRLAEAGAILLGKLNMHEFAYGPTGVNPHYGTPRNPWDRKTGRAPGGSSSGAAVAVADGMCVMGLGSDTRGSIRQPAALCGVAGFKPTARRVPREGVFPLSYTLDSVGPLANTVPCCAAYDAVLAAEPVAVLPEFPVRGLRLLLPRSSAIEDLDPEVAKAFDSALATLARAGAAIAERPVPAFDRQDVYFRNGGFPGAEAWHIHRGRLDRLAEFDPRVGKRILIGAALTAADYIELGFQRAAYIREVGAVAAAYDAILMPTAPCIAPTIAEADAGDDAFFRWTLRIVRNTGLVNFLDGCAASVPCHAPGAAPVGLMVCGVALADRHVLAVAAAIERALRPRA